MELKVDFSPNHVSVDSNAKRLKLVFGLGPRTKAEFLYLLIIWWKDKIVHGRDSQTNLQVFQGCSSKFLNGRLNAFLTLNVDYFWYIPAAICVVHKDEIFINFFSFINQTLKLFRLNNAKAKLIYETKHTGSKNINTYVTLCTHWAPIYTC